MVVQATATEQIEMLGPETQVPWTVHANASSILVCARGSPVVVNSVDGGTEPLTLPTHEAVDVTAVIKAGDNYYLTGLKTARLSVIYRYTIT